MQDPEEDLGDDDEEGEEAEPEDLTVYEYKPPESRPWESLGSELEIDEGIIKQSRDLVRSPPFRKGWHLIGYLETIILGDNESDAATKVFRSASSVQRQGKRHRKRLFYRLCCCRRQEF